MVKKNKQIVKMNEIINGANFIPIFRAYVCLKNGVCRLIAFCIVSFYKLGKYPNSYIN